jgi:hypothetical protein
MRLYRQRAEVLPRVRRLSGTARQVAAGRAGNPRDSGAKGN